MQRPSVSRAGEQAHTVGLTEERAAQIVRQSGNARNVAFLAVLIVVLFIPVYWFYDIGMPVLGVDGRLDEEADRSTSPTCRAATRSILANCASCQTAERRPGRATSGRR